LNENFHEIEEGWLKYMEGKELKGTEKSSRLDSIKNVNLVSANVFQQMRQDEVRFCSEMKS